MVVNFVYCCAHAYYYVCGLCCEMIWNHTDCNVVEYQNKELEDVRRKMYGGRHNSLIR